MCFLTIESMFSYYTVSKQYAKHHLSMILNPPTTACTWNLVVNIVVNAFANAVVNVAVNVAVNIIYIRMYIIYIFKHKT